MEKKKKTKKKKKGRKRKKEQRREEGGQEKKEEDEGGRRGIGFVLAGCGEEGKDMDVRIEEGELGEKQNKKESLVCCLLYLEQVQKGTREE